MAEMIENIFERVKQQKLISLTPRKALNKAFLKVKPSRNEIESFKTNLITLLDRTNDTESEEFHKNLVIDFLKKTYYDPSHFINTKDKKDLVIHNGQNANSTVGVIIEAKKPNNKDKMITTQNLNKDAFHKLVLYYLRERITHKNLEVKHLIVTNINEWFIFDANLFDRLFAQNKELIKQFEDFENNRLVEKTTDFFYKQIAEPFINTITDEIEFTYFNIQEYQKPLRNNDKEDDNLLITLFKIFSPEHLLKLPFANDSNTLNKEFYNELLHIIGLTEIKKEGKKLIERKEKDERNSGSILESAIIQIESLDKLSQIQNINQFGNTEDEQLFNIAIELSITWINRILFLKLLEAQLVGYHKKDKSYSFLNLEKIKSYDDLNSLFFQVLAKKYEERSQDVQKDFEKIPYLNSSLFEPTELEQNTLFISNLKGDKTIPVLSQTVLKDQQAKKRAGNLNTLEYLFEFLDAYDFGAEGREEIQEENKTLISASVLGLIFEKINGYKDGSFFTPSFITMYMCRETICKAVIQKLNDSQNWNCNNFNELKEDITNFIKTHPEGRKFARKITNNKINEIKICDPAVGSGHFLVSALNEMIAVKAALGVLVDRDYEPINQYELRVENDELITTDLDNNLFKYNPTNKESQRIQEALFHEKQTIIENCLFGVDINPNSVQICRLRLWIELLKNAYYKVPQPSKKGVPQLETLPNIDINIKCGNSLISRFDLHEKYNINSEKGKIIDEYKSIVAKYKNSLSPVDKNQIRERIKNIKNTFIEEFNANSLWVKKLNRRELELAKRERQIIEEETKIKLLGKDFEAEANKNIKNLKANIQVINKEIKEIKLEIEQEKNQEIYRKAFEWRFEFPEVLDENGNFTGFDMVIGNPPYIRADIDSLEYQQFRKYIESGYETVYEKWDIIIPFYERAMKLLKSGGHNCFIVSESIASSKYTFKLQDWLIKNYKIYKLNYFENIEVFKGVGVVPLISHIHKIGCNKYEIEKIIHNTNFAELNITRIFIDKDTDRAIVFKKKFKRFDTQVESELLGNICYISVGMVINADEKKIKGEFVKDDLLSDVKDKIHPKQIVEGKDLKAYLIERKKYFEWGTDRVPAKLRRATFPELYEGEKILRGRVTKGTFDNTGILCNDGVMVLKKFIDLKKVHNNSIESSITRNNNKTRKQLEDISQDYNLKYILAILNSKFAMNFLNNVRRHRLLNYFYPDDLRKLPIPKISQKEQKPFIDLVEKILSLKEQNKDTKKLEEKIDKLVYKLYELTEEEIKIIEESK